ncbi:PRC-barrel domain containing protein [Roseospira marina]|uniref:PRC-barrel domain containing protein n=1 Tax=Roseospira marina TaxID=140057 RepID=A0A5M6IDI5_9PROT|nr:PRC-barrel domain-containing protein [Roseospira marina]KAA5606303.1 PRC-barrel domain containing protein [Roseospira marina]MBB4314464.1 sporulation protein YlmC with PRC-barrel domain [Roseospira marina]MBB5087624.1 sporulation protein YlmC with PRC-barrel domain [Roseospira marina]
MRRLLATTAIVTFAAFPLTATAASMNDGAHSDTGTAESPTQHTATLGQSIPTSALIGMAVYTNTATDQGESGPDRDATGQETVGPGLADVPETWEAVGDVDDVLIDSDGTVSGLVVDASGFFELDEKLIRVDMDTLRFIPDSDDEGDFFVYYTGDRAVLQDQDYERSDAGTSAETSDGMTASEMMGTEGTANDTGNERMGALDRPAMTDSAVRNLSAETLGAARVYSRNGEWIGDIGDVLIDESGQVTNVVVDVGGFLGIGEKPVALGFDQIKVVPGADGEDDLSVQVMQTEDELKSMQTYSE